MNADYRKGIEDAWNLACKIANMDYDVDTKIFGCENPFEYSYDEVQKMVQNYEKYDVGDIIKVNSRYHDVGVITDVNDGWSYVLYQDGKCGYVQNDPAEITKLNKHLDIPAILKLMQTLGADVN